MSLCSGRVYEFFLEVENLRKKGVSVVTLNADTDSEERQQVGLSD